MEEWFAAVKQRRETGHTKIEEPEDAEMSGNALTAELLGGAPDGE